MYNKKRHSEKIQMKKTYVFSLWALDIDEGNHLKWLQDAPLQLSMQDLTRISLTAAFPGLIADALTWMFRKPEIYMRDPGYCGWCQPRK